LQYRLEKFGIKKPGGE